MKPDSLQVSNCSDCLVFQTAKILKTSAGVCRKMSVLYVVVTDNYELQHLPDTHHSIVAYATDPQSQTPRYTPIRWHKVPLDYHKYDRAMIILERA